MIFTLLLFIMPTLIYSDEPQILSSKTSKQRFSETGINFLAIFQLLSIGYFLIYFIFSFCCCSSGEKECLPVFIYFLGIILLFITSIIAYVGVSKLKNNYYSSYSKQSLNEVKNLLDRNYKNIILLCDNVTKQRDSTYSGIKSLIKAITEYNSRFSNKKTKNEISNDLKIIDSTQQKILLFSNLSIQFSNSTQKIINKIKKKCLSSSEQTKYLLEYSINNKRAKKVNSEKYLFEMSIQYSNFIVTSVLFMSLVYGFIYFIENRCSCVCLYLFPLCSILILFFGSVGCFNIHSDDYSTLNRICFRYRKENLDDFEQIIFDATHCFSSIKNTNNISHIYKEYENIKNKEKIDISIGNKLKRIIDNICTIDKQLDQIFNNSESAFNESLAVVGTLKSDCSTLIMGCDLCIIAKILLFLGLFISSFAICTIKEPSCCKCRHKGYGNYSGSTPRETSESSSSTLHVVLIYSETRLKYENA
ncbi:hypothetical protein M9Y10_019613 [Tritrichomonas musculus]|uniref:Uncharacterized protein n=1 Tax=Tritrichomonas musculus TaxID=1915356 RepID=A0ABR2HHT0_9EUKA